MLPKATSCKLNTLAINFASDFILVCWFAICELCAYHHITLFFLVALYYLISIVFSLTFYCYGLKCYELDVSKGSLFMLEFMHMMTKLRPFVRPFLKEASEMFEMYIYTMGDRPYALEMAKLLDPGREYFNAKVISRDDGTQRHQKGLDVVLGQESAVLILDDTENVS